MSLLPDPSSPAVSFTEAAAWSGIGEGWRPLQGSFRELGFSVEWHDFATERDFDWSPSFHPRGVEICLNLAGRGEVSTGSRKLELGPLRGGFYFQDEAELRGVRMGGERHRFVTVELSLPLISQYIGCQESGLHPGLKKFLLRKTGGDVSTPVRLSPTHQQLAVELSRPPVPATGRRLWYRAKALEIASEFFFQPDATEEFFCERHNRQNQERVQRVVAVLRDNLAATPSLEEIGRRVGCSQFYLSRIFSQEMGRSIFQHLRMLRMERAAELLRERKMNVTQVAMEVGYASPSHFSTAFHETFGCCPGLYPLRTLSPDLTEQLKTGPRR